MTEQQTDRDQTTTDEDKARAEALRKQWQFETHYRHDNREVLSVSMKGQDPKNPDKVFETYLYRFDRGTAVALAASIIHAVVNGNMITLQDHEVVALVEVGLILNRIANSTLPPW
jgi:hypothetical protein